MLYTDPAGTYAVVDDGGGGATCPYGSHWNPSTHSCTGYGTGGGGGGGWDHAVVAPIVAPPVIEPAPIIGPGGMPFMPVLPPVTGVCIGSIFILGPGWQEYQERQVEMFRRMAEQPRTQTQPQPTVQPTPSAPTPTVDSDPCNNIDVPPGVTVEQVVGSTVYRPIQNTVTKSIVVNYARAMCRGAKFPAIPYVQGVDYPSITDGHHRFVASRLARKPIYFVLEVDLRKFGGNFPSLQWKDVRWN